MRNLPPRPTLPPAVEQKLQAGTQTIRQIANPQEQAERARTLYNSVRASKWFRPVIEALRSLCGDGELCMYCSCNEPSQVEHYCPLSVFPEQALDYQNYLWTCDICNRTHKGDRFPPDTEPGERCENGSLTREDLRLELDELRAEPFQADVADYFLNGPGRVQEPFRSALKAAEEPSA